MARKKVTFQGFNGDALSALLEYPDQPAVATVLFAHCFSCGKDIAAASRIARALVRHGYAVLRFDFTGLGNSDGDFANSNFSSNVQDLILAAEYLGEHYQSPRILIGHSLGGTAVLAAAGQLPEVGAVVTIGAPFDPAHVLKQFGSKDLAVIAAEGEAVVSLAGRDFSIQQQFLDDVSTQTLEGAIGKLRRALLVFHSPVDKTVSINEAEKIYVNARHPKSFVSLDSADHLLTKKEDAEYVASTIAAWSIRYIKSATVDLVAQGESEVKRGEVVVAEHNHDFTRRVTSDQHHWFADEPVSVGGQDLGPDPYEHLLASLGTCTSMTMRMYANRKKLPVEDINVRLWHDRSYDQDCEGCEEEPKKIENLNREISIKGDLTDAERNRLMEIANRCPVHRTLEADLRILTHRLK